VCPEESRRSASIPAAPRDQLTGSIANVKNGNSQLHTTARDAKPPGLESSKERTMPQEFNLQEALRLAIQTEKDVMDFYNKAAALTKSERGRTVFIQLAGEEREHASHFFQVYPGKDLGTFEEFMAKPAHSEQVMLRQLEKALNENVHDRKAMEIALKEEEDLAKQLRLTASKIVDPQVRAVFERMAKETENHFALIESEYAHLMGMVHETDIDTYVRE
jgi:rubrerythrin